MGSLFDLAAGLSQYDDVRSPALLVSPTEPNTACGNGVKKPLHDLLAITTTTPSNQDGDAPSDADSSALSLLHETLLTIYAARQPPSQPQSELRRYSPQPIALTSQRSAPQLLLDRAATNTLGEQNQKHRATHKTTPKPLQSVFAQSLTVRSASVRTIPPPPKSPPSNRLPLSSVTVDSIRSRAGPIDDPDVVARKTLREIQDELEQLPAAASSSPKRRQYLHQSLSDKYLHQRLNKLPSTPFVQLARKKTQQKIDLLTSDRQPATAETVLAPMASPSTFPADQHTKLIKLAAIPYSHVAKLSKTQQQMVEFAKRYDKILRLSRDELASLPVSQTQLLQQLQKQL